MDENSINKELRQKLNFSCCEEESRNKEGQEAPEGGEAPSHTPEKAPGWRARPTPPRTPRSEGRGLPTFQEKGPVSPEPLLSGSPRCPATPAQPDDRSQLLYCESPFTPKVSVGGGGGPRPQGEGPRFLQAS